MLYQDLQSSMQFAVQWNACLGALQPDQTWPAFSHFATEGRREQATCASGKRFTYQRRREGDVGRLSKPCYSLVRQPQRPNGSCPVHVHQKRFPLLLPVQQVSQVT